MSCKNKNHSCNSCGNKCGSKHTCHSNDVVEVVRCKDCKHYDDGECVYHSEPKKMRQYERWEVYVSENDYCSYGERKQNEQR